MEGTDIVLDSFHLLSQDWPYELGQQLFDCLLNDLHVFVYGDTHQGFESVYEHVVLKLGLEPMRLEYLKGYYDHPNRSSCYYIKWIPGNMGKMSSQPAEAKLHASIIANCGPGSTQDMVIQIMDLLSRQTELEVANMSANTKYKLLSLWKAHEVEAQKDISEALALQTLSTWGYKEYWTLMCQESLHYSLCPDQGDKYDCVHWNGTAIDSARLVPKECWCSCNSHIEAESMCPP